MKFYTFIRSFFLLIINLRIEISDHERTSEDSLPNETTVKFINEVSSKVSKSYLWSVNSVMFDAISVTGENRT